MNFNAITAAVTGARRAPGGGGSAPAFTSAPVIISTPTVGSPCSCTAGGYTGTATVVVTYQWTLNGANISGATSATYTPITGDIGGALRRQDILTNAYGGPITSGGLSAPATVVAAGSSTVTSVLHASRTSGAAPLTVWFDALDSSSTRTGKTDSQNLVYTFDYGDSGGGNWAATAGYFTHSKNSDVGGGIGGHTFDTPGTYTVTMTPDDTGPAATPATVTITVEDPNVRWAGTKTVCINATGTSDGLGPSGCTYQNTMPSWTSFTDKRYLFRAGLDFTSLGDLYINSLGQSNSRVDSYGSGAQPIINGVYLCVDSPSSGATNYSTDFQILNSDITTGMQTRCEEHVSIYKNTIRESLTISNLLNYTGQASRRNQRYILISENTFPGGDGSVSTQNYNIFAFSMTQSLEFGNVFEKAYYHNVRHITQYRTGIRHNIVKGKGSNQGIYHCIKLHAADGASGLNGGAGQQWSQFKVNSAGDTWLPAQNVVADNVIGDAAALPGWYLAVDPEADGKQEAAQTTVVENNKLVIKTGGAKGTIVLGGRNITYIGNTNSDGSAANVTTGVNMSAATAFDGPYNSTR